MNREENGISKEMLELLNINNGVDLDFSDYDENYENAFNGDYDDFYDVNVEDDLYHMNIFTDNWLDDVDYSRIDMNSDREVNKFNDLRVDAMYVAKVFRHFNWREPYSKDELINYIENGQYGLDLNHYLEMNRHTDENNIPVTSMLRSVFDERVFDKWENRIYRVGQYVNATSYMVFKCEECGGMFIREGRQVYNGAGCPKCHRRWNKGEQLVESILKELCVEYYKQDPDGCINPETNKYLPYDFILPNNGRTLYVEVNGLQHYESVEYFGGKENLEKIINRDNIKKAYANENGTYVEIDYREHDVKILRSRVEKILLPLIERGDM